VRNSSTPSSRTQIPNDDDDEHDDDDDDDVDVDVDVDVVVAVIQALATVINGLARLDAKPSAEFLEAFVEDAIPKLPRFSPQVPYLELM
jgi:hypothetical protein